MNSRKIIPCQREREERESMNRTKPKCGGGEELVKNDIKWVVPFTWKITLKTALQRERERPKKNGMNLKQREILMRETFEF